MRKVKFTDKNGYRCAALVRDGDPDEMAKQGVPLCPPDLNKLDWDAIKRNLHNELVERDLFTWNDVQREQNGITAALHSVLRRQLVTLYREEQRRKRADQRPEPSGEYPHD